jgi:hypothetical protein
MESNNNFNVSKQERLNSGHTHTDACLTADRICSLARLLSEGESDQKGGRANKEEGKLIKEKNTNKGKKLLTCVRRKGTVHYAGIFIYTCV